MNPFLDLMDLINQSSVAEAVHWPKPVFQEWLRFRREAADQLAGLYTDQTAEERLYVLELSAMIKAIYN